MCACVHLAPAGVQVVAVGGEEQMGEASVVAGRQQSQQGAVLAGVEASAAGVRATGVNRLARAEAKAGDDATLALLLNCSEDNRGAFGLTRFTRRHNHFYSMLTFLAAPIFLITFSKEENIFLNNAHMSSRFGSSVSFYRFLLSQSSLFLTL